MISYGGIHYAKWQFRPSDTKKLGQSMTIPILFQNFGPHHARDGPYRAGLCAIITLRHRPLHPRDTTRRCAAGASGEKKHYFREH